MQFIEKLLNISRKNNSLVCVGLDTDIGKIPEKFLKDDDPVLSFNKCIIDRTCDIVSAYKVNSAFYEVYGEKGWLSFKNTISYIPKEVVTIADVKRGDIGNTAAHYAEAFLSRMGCDAVTVNPYLGHDSIIPFLEYKDKGVFILCLTSNIGSGDFQKLKVNGKYVYQIVAEKIIQLNEYKNCGLVVGATYPEELKLIRETAPDMPFLLPGIGAQGGDLQKTVEFGTDSNGELAVINSSRGIIYKSKGDDFADAARKAADELRNQINQARREKQ